MLSPFLGGVNAVEVKTSESPTILHIHDAIVAAIPYFHAQKERWKKRTHEGHAILQVELPEGASVDAFALVIEKVYFPARRLHYVGFDMSLKMVRVASMLDCSDAVLEGLVLLVQDSVSSDADVDNLCQFVDDHQVPKGLTKLMRRLKKKDKNCMDMDTLKTMLKNCANGRNRDMFKVAEQHLKAWSRAGGTTREQVANILKTVHDQRMCNSQGSDNEDFISLAADFVETHAQYYVDIVRAVFNDKALTLKMTDQVQAGDQVQAAFALVGKWFRRFAEIGLAHFEQGSLSEGDFATLYETSVQKSLKIISVNSNVYCKTLLLVEDCLNAFIAILPRFSGTAQVTVIQTILVATSPFHQTILGMVSETLIKNLLCEARSLFMDSVVKVCLCFVRSSNLDVSEVLTVQIVELMNLEAKVLLCARAHSFAPEVRAALLRSVALDNVDSDDGF
mmetsp:Transcript_70287/g.155424  ORF Transcript_70287/g.155424 Transcript_70287/m.155424 type:complete len:449 (+) Transcript_70287:76-1422(+)